MELNNDTDVEGLGLERHESPPSSPPILTRGDSGNSDKKPESEVRP